MSTCLLYRNNRQAIFYFIWVTILYGIYHISKHIITHISNIHGITVLAHMLAVVLTCHQNLLRLVRLQMDLQQEQKVWKMLAQLV
jgi:uncharacterized membrane protein YadS